jgi:hypothetical protein
MWPLYPMEYYAAVRKNKMLSFMTTWVELEIVTLNSLICRSKNGIIAVESRIVVVRGWGE